MAEHKSLPLNLIINASVQNKEKLLSNSSFNRLCIIGKSVNGRNTPSGIYKSAAQVAADYGVEAGEYLLAVRHFNQFQDGEVLIASAAYDSITRPAIIEPIPEPEPEPEPDEDFVGEYVAVGYEPIDPSPVYPIPPPEPEPPEPEPPVIACESNEAVFRTVRFGDNAEGLESAEISLWAYFEINGVDYLAGWSSMQFERFKRLIDDNGAGLNSNQLLTTLLTDFIDNNPDQKDFLLSHTNFSLSSYDFGRRFSGIDVNNKDDLIETIEYIGGKAENFKKDPTTITIKSVPVGLLSSKRKNTMPLSFIDVFNKGKNFVLNSCLSFDYTSPDVIDIACISTKAEFNIANSYYLQSDFSMVVFAKINIGGVDNIISINPMKTKDLKSSVDKNGAAFMGNKILTVLINSFIESNPANEEAFNSNTNYLLSSYDFSRSLSGIDSINKDLISSALSSAGGEASNFTNNKSLIKFKAMTMKELESVYSGEAVAVDFLDIFNKGLSLDIHSCLSFDYEKPKRGGVIVNPTDPTDPTDPDIPNPDDWELIPPLTPPAVTTPAAFSFTTVNGYSASSGFNTVAAPFSIKVAYGAGEAGHFTVKENGVVIFDSELSIDYAYGMRPFYGDYEVHHVIQSYIRKSSIIDGSSSHTINLVDNYKDTTKKDQPVYDVGGEIIGYEDVIHPLLEERSTTNNYTIEPKSGSMMSVEITLESLVDPSGQPCSLTVSNFGTHFNNAMFNTKHHNLTVPSILPPTMTNLDWMFAYANKFNQDISMWDMRYVRSMQFFFVTNPVYDKNLSSLCLTQFDPNNPDGLYKYTDFNEEFISLPSLHESYYPIWGFCPAVDESP